MKKIKCLFITFIFMILSALPSVALDQVDLDIVFPEIEYNIPDININFYGLFEYLFAMPDMLPHGIFFKLLLEQDLEP